MDEHDYLVLLYPSVKYYSMFHRARIEDEAFRVFSTMIVYRSARDLVRHSSHSLYAKKRSCPSHIHKHPFSPRYSFSFSPLPLLAFSALFP